VRTEEYEVALVEAAAGSGRPPRDFDIRLSRIHSGPKCMVDDIIYGRGWVVNARSIDRDVLCKKQWVVTQTSACLLPALSSPFIHYATSVYAFANRHLAVGRAVVCDE
jgi:hypothetical protein